MTGAINRAGQIRSPTMLCTDLPHAHSPAATLAVSLDEIRPLRLLASDAGISLADILKNLDLSPEVLDGSRAHSVALADYFRILE